MEDVVINTDWDGYTTMQPQVGTTLLATCVTPALRHLLSSAWETEPPSKTKLNPDGKVKKQIEQFFRMLLNKSLLLQLKNTH